MHSPLEIARSYVEVSIHKTHLSAFKMIILGMFAGFFIGFAGIASTTASSTIADPSAAKLLGAAVFPAGMAMVLIAGSELFTGNTLIILAVLEKRIPVSKMLKNWFFVFVGNFLGAALVALAVVYGHTPNLFGGDLAASVVAAGASRCNLSFSEGLIRGILCNVLVCIAVWMSFGDRSIAGKLMASFWPIMLFVLCGFEHSVADMYFGTAALLTSHEYGIAAEGLTWARFFTNCIIPVTLGNIIGGAGIVGCGYWLGYLRHTPLSPMTKEQEQEEIDIAEEYGPTK